MIGKKKFVVVILNPKDEVFVVYVAFIRPNSNINPFYITQIALLKADKVFSSFQSKYDKFADVFSKNLVTELLKYTKINNHIMYLVEDHQSPYRLIYDIRSVKVETLKTYMKINVANGFIRSNKKRYYAQNYTKTEN